MKLYFADTSPYARKARMTIIEKDLDEKVDLIFRNPFDDPDDLKMVNPLGKVPVLVTTDGQALFDSSVICAYLDTLSDHTPLIPAASPDRWAVLSNAALADGILDAAFATVIERRRPAVQQSSMWLDRWSAAILRSVDAVEADLTGFTGRISLAQIGLGAALGYLDFRLPDIDWRHGRGRIAEWFDEFSMRPAMQQTRPENQ